MSKKTEKKTEKKTDDNKTAFPMPHNIGDGSAIEPPKAEVSDEDGRKAAQALGVNLDDLDAQKVVDGEPFTIDGHDKPLIKHLRQFIAQYRVIRGSSTWHALPMAQRYLLTGAFYWSRELLGEPVPRGEPATLREALGNKFPRKLVGVMADRTAIARARNRGKISEDEIRDVVERVR